MSKQAPQIVTLSGIEFRTKFGPLVRETMATIILESIHQPVAIYRPLTPAEEQEFFNNEFLPMENLRETIKHWGTVRRRIAQQGGQAILYRIAPAGVKEGKNQSIEEILGVMTLLTEKQAASIKQNGWSGPQVKEFSRIRKDQRQDLKQIS